MTDPLSASAQKVQDAITAKGFGAIQVVELPDSTRTAAEAAAAIGCTVAQIAKSLIFKAQDSGAAILVIASGTNRVDTDIIAARIGEPLGNANAEFVREATGFVIGGVPPVGHTSALRTFIDQDLRQYDVIWAAAGTPRAVFQLTPDDLIAMTGGEVVAVM